MTLAIICYDLGDVDIIRDVPKMTNKNDIEEYLQCELNYDLDYISWIEVTGRINELTPEDFG